MECNFNGGLSLHGEYSLTHNPHHFWNEINRLGPTKSGEIPMEVELENGERSSVLEVVLIFVLLFVLLKWKKRDFADLLS